MTIHRRCSIQPLPSFTSYPASLSCLRVRKVHAGPYSVSTPPSTTIITDLFAVNSLARGLDFWLGVCRHRRRAFTLVPVCEPGCFGAKPARVAPAKPLPSRGRTRDRTALIGFQLFLVEHAMLLFFWPKPVLSGMSLFTHVLLPGVRT